MTGFVLLVELHRHDQIRITDDGRVTAKPESAGDDVASRALLQLLKVNACRPTCSALLRHLACGSRATRLVWLRLVDDGAASAKPVGLLHRKARFAFTEARATTRPRQYLADAVIDAAEAPIDAVILWHGLRALRLDTMRSSLGPRIVERLDDGHIPPALRSLTDALDQVLAEAQHASIAGRPLE